jgi:hypothetical protein
LAIGKSGALRLKQKFLWARPTLVGSEEIFDLYQMMNTMKRPMGLSAGRSRPRPQGNHHIDSIGMKIAIVGIGYVGLPLSLQFARWCVSALRLAVDAKKVQILNNGQSYIKHIEPSAIAELVGSGKFSASIDFSRISLSSSRQGK